MHHLVLISLVVFVVALVAGLAAVAVQGLALWRAFRRVRRTVLGRLGELADELGRLERRSTDAATTAARLDHARARLQESLSTAAILSAAAGQAWSVVGRIRSVVPRKT